MTTPLQILPELSLELLDRYAEPLLTLSYASLVFLLVYAVGRFLILSPVRRALVRSGFELHVRKTLLKLLHFLVFVSALLVGIGVAGYGDVLLSFTTIAAAATLAIGYASREGLANFVSGVVILVEKPFRIGDWVEWDGNAGTVEDVGLRSTRVITWDNEVLTVPNTELTDGVVKNPVSRDRLRLRVTFGIGYDDDIRKATGIILEEAERHGEVLDSPEPNVRLTGLADDYVELETRLWIPDPSHRDTVKIRSDFTQMVKRHFDREGISLPGPQRELSGELRVDRESDTGNGDTEDPGRSDDEGSGPS